MRIRKIVFMIIRALRCFWETRPWIFISVHAHNNILVSDNLCTVVSTVPFLPANFTGNSAFHLDHIRGAGEAEAPQNSLPALQLVHLQHGPSFLQLSLGRSNVCCDLKHTHPHTYCYTTQPSAKVTLGHSSTISRKDFRIIRSALITTSCFVHELISNITH